MSLLDGKTHWVKYEGCEPHYCTPQEAHARFNASAFVGDRDVILGNIAEGGLDGLKKEETFLRIRSELRRRGLNDDEKRYAAEEYLFKLHAMAGNCFDDVELDTERGMIEIPESVGIWPEYRKGIGRCLRYVFCVQSTDEDDADIECDTMTKAILEAGKRAEHKRILRILDTP